MSVIKCVTDKNNTFHYCWICFYWVLSGFSRIPLGIWYYCSFKISLELYSMFQIWWKLKIWDGSVSDIKKPILPYYDECFGEIDW